MTAVDDTGVVTIEEPPPLVMRIEISGPGVYSMPDKQYHGDPAPAVDGGSLSSTGARKIVPPGTCAKFRHWQQNGEAPKAEFSFGHAAHQKVLHEGAVIDVIDAPDWRKKDAREARDASLAAGRIPLLTKDNATVEAMAEALLAHPMAARLLSPDRGMPEQSLFWRHPRTGRWCRARLDHLPTTGVGRRYVVADYKSTNDASEEGFLKSIVNFRYYQQGPFYLDGVRVLGIDPDPVFVFIAQEKDPPFLVNVIELDHDAMTLGRRYNDVAHTRFDNCLTSGRWPGYGDDVKIASLPTWLLRREDL